MDSTSPNRRAPSRRSVLRGAGATGLALAGGPTLAAPADGPLAELPLRQVVLATGVAQTQAMAARRLVLGLDEDSLLQPFRARAGMAAPGVDLGGWYGTNAFAPGATFGQWVSALARFYAVDGDAAAGAKARRLIGLYGETLGNDGFYRNNRFPAYTYDKLVAGLLDTHAFTGEPAAPALLDRTADLAEPFLPDRAQPRVEVNYQPGTDFSQHAWDESYTLPENQFLAWRATGRPRHLAVGRRLLYDDFFLALARGENALSGKHAYSHVNALSSAAQAYLTVGSRPHLDAARNGLAFVEAQSFATGGWGPDEHFVEPVGDALARSLTANTHTFETPCGAYAHLKLTRYLLRITRDPQYGDSAERVLYNTLLGATPIAPDGRAFYYSDYGPQAHKTTHPDPWPCCSGTLPLAAADQGRNIAFTDARGLWVNLYLPGTVAWTQDDADCRVSLTGDYPLGRTVSLHLETSAPRRFSVFLRTPAWAHGARLKIDDEPARPVAAGAFAEVRRVWRGGERLTLDLPPNPRLVPVDTASPGLVALMWGPLALMRVFGPDEPVGSPLRADALLAARGPGMDGATWRLAEGDVRLRPFLAIGTEAYSLYQPIVT